MNPLKTGVCDMDGVKVPEEKKGGVVSDWKDEAAFEKLFREWYAPLCGYAESLLHDRDASEDVVRGVFCTLWEKRETLRVEESVKSYLYRAVYNAAINMLEHEKVKAAFARFLHEREEAGENNRGEMDWWDIPTNSCRKKWFCKKVVYEKSIFMLSPDCGYGHGSGGSEPEYYV